MRLFLLLIALISFWNVSAFAYERRVYINKEGLRVASVFNSPGFDSSTCQDSPKYCQSIAWPDRNSEVIDLGVREKVWVKDDDGNDKQVEYAKVKVSYIRVVPRYPGDQEGYLADKNGVVGYIDAALISNTQEKSFYEPTPEKTIPCPPKSKTKSALDNKTQKTIEPLKELATELPASSVVAAAEKLRTQVGECVSRDGKRDLPVTYDGYAYEQIANKPLPNVAGEDGKRITRQQFLDIDTVSRTVYSEMAKCYKYGLQYPMAVARVAVNRAEAQRAGYRSEFIKANHKNKGLMGKVVTDPYQFSAWNKKDKNKNGELVENPVLKQALCPPQDPKKKFWKKNGLPSIEEQEIWEDTVRIATEAVLFPTSFNKRTNQVKAYFYTSEMDRDDMKLMSAPSIEGRAASRPSCMKFWSDGKR